MNHSTSQTASSLHDAKRRGVDWIDMQAIMRVRNLAWRAKTIVEGLHNGLHRSPRHGFSVEFSEYRPFGAGDDPRTVDWKLFARSDRFYIKKFEDETNRRCLLVLDQSQSMRYRSLEYSKLEYAKTIAATLAFFWLQQRDAVGAIAFDEVLREWIPPRYRSGQLQRILGLFEREADGGQTNLAAPLERISEMVRRRSLVVVISDFLVPYESIRSSLAFLKARRHEVLLLQVLDPKETRLSFDKPVMVQDLETKREVFVDPATASTVYEERFQAHQTGWRQMAESLGVQWKSLITSEAPSQVLLDVLHSKNSQQ